MKKEAGKRPFNKLHVHHQCDQMAGLICQYLAIRNNQNVPKKCQSRYKILANNPKNWPKIKNLPKWRNFAEFGHTNVHVAVSTQIALYNCNLRL